MKLFHRKNTVPKYHFDPKLQKPVMYSSICTGEKRIGFEWRENGRFEEVACIRSQRDLDDFLETYGLRAEDVEVKY